MATLQIANDSDVIVLRGSQWNEVLRRLDACERLTVGDGLEIASAGGAKAISLSATEETIIALVGEIINPTSPATVSTSGVGYYRGYLCDTTAATGEISNPAIGSDFDCIIHNVAEQYDGNAISGTDLDYEIYTAPLPCVSFSGGIGQIRVLGRFAGFCAFDGTNGIGVSADKGLPIVEVSIITPTIRNVKVTMDGGSAGNKTTQCSFTYTFIDPQGVTQTAQAAVWGRRPTHGKMNVGTRGIVRYIGRPDDRTPAWVLWDVDETEVRKACS